MTSTELQTARDAQITKSNDLVHRARYNLNLAEQRLLLYLIAHISPYDTKLPVIEFSIVDFLKVIGISYSSTCYQECKDMIQTLADKSFWIDNGQEISLHRWIANAKIIKNTGRVTILLDEGLKPYLLQLRKNFVTYELAYTLLFKSKYSPRLYEFAKSIKYNNLQESIDYRITPDKLRDVLGVFHYDAKGKITKNDYPRYPDFKRRVLAKSIAEINSQTDIEITMTEQTQGRKVVGIVLHIAIKNVMERIRLREEIDRALDLAAGIDPDQTIMPDFQASNPLE